MAGRDLWSRLAVWLFGFFIRYANGNAFLALNAFDYSATRATAGIQAQIIFIHDY